MQTQAGSMDSTAVRQAAAVARALSILFNNSRIYGMEHPVFLKTLNEHMPFFQDALSDAGELVLSFVKGKVRSGVLLLDPGSSVFESLAHMLEGMGVSGICFKRGITSEEVAKLVAIMAQRGDAVSDGGLQRLLEEDGVRHILEKKINLDMDGGTKPQEAPDGKTDEPAVKPAPVASAGRTFELDDDAPALDADFKMPEISRPDDSGSSEGIERSRPFKEFVAGTLGNLA